MIRKSILMRTLLFAIPAAALVVLPIQAGPFWQYLLANMLLLAVFALSFNVLFGMTGFLSFGHAAFFAIGAYVSGGCLLGGFPLVIALTSGTVASALAAGVIGFFCIRHTKIYFSLLTLAFGMMVYAIVWKWTAVTGGDDGLVGIPKGSLEIPGLVPRGLPGIYVVVCVVSLAAIAVLYRIHHSPFGLILNGIRENYGRVDFAGINARRALLLAFVLAGTFAGLAGSMMAPLESTVSPSAAHWTKSAEPVMATLIGGPYTFFGPAIGAAVFIGLKELIVRVTEHWLLIFGIVLMAIVLGFRGGIAGFMADHWRSTPPRRGLK
ncbi:MAG: branched-chain amino acid ABC transporter permease [Rhodospirillales bacterium]|nr:branched-chain amino acid ABC transporter permease [Rhodospirillales bacterium]